MKDIGIKLKDKREENGLSIDEVAEDLKLRPNQINSIEEGKIDDFKEIFYLKYFIRDYAKYLGLDSEKILDEFNEYLFDMTSKIPVDLIETAKNVKQKDSAIVSPYTMDDKRQNVIIKILLSLFMIIVIFIVSYVMVSIYKGNDFSNKNITYNIRR